MAREYVGQRKRCRHICTVYEEQTLEPCGTKRCAIESAHAECVEHTYLGQHFVNCMRKLVRSPGHQFLGVSQKMRVGGVPLRIERKVKAQLERHFAHGEFGMAIMALISLPAEAWRSAFLFKARYKTPDRNGVRSLYRSPEFVENKVVHRRRTRSTFESPDELIKGADFIAVLDDEARAKLMKRLDQNFLDSLVELLSARQDQLSAF